MHESAKIFLECTNNIQPEIAVILGSGLTNFFNDENIKNFEKKSIRKDAERWIWI